MNELTQRTSRAVASILGNESLTADLDDAAAGALIDWGVACAERIAQSTASLDDLEAEEAMSPRLRATRQLMRSANRWIAGRREMDAEEKAASLARIIEQAAIIYDRALALSDYVQREVYLRQSLDPANDPSQAIVRLRAFIEDLDHGLAMSNPENRHDLPDSQDLQNENRIAAR